MLVHYSEFELYEYWYAVAFGYMQLLQELVKKKSRSGFEVDKTLLQSDRVTQIMTMCWALRSP